MKCNHCGAEIPDDSIYCEQCGKKLDLGGKRPSTKMLVWLGVAALAIVAVVLIFTLSGNSKGGEDEPGNGIETAANTIKDGDSDAVKAAKMMDQMIRIMEQEPDATGYKKMMELTMKMQQVANFSEEEVNKALADINPAYGDDSAMKRKLQPLLEKWQDWREANRKEAGLIDSVVISEYRY